MRIIPLLIALHGVAAADSFTTMDRQSAGTDLGFEASYVADTDTVGDIVRFDVHGQSVGRSGFGVYGALPFATRSGPDDGVAIGDVELGAVFIPRLRSFLLVLHAGIALPTGTNGFDNDIIRTASAARITDFYLSLPRATSLRFGGSPIIRSGNVFFRGDFGVDVNLDVDNRAQADTVLRLDGAVGVDLGNVFLSGEFVNAFDTRLIRPGWIDTAAIAIRFFPHALHPYAAVVFPLDQDARDLFHIAFTVGADIPLR